MRARNVVISWDVGRSDETIYYSFNTLYLLLPRVQTEAMV
jgi:hypothetical protein